MHHPGRIPAALYGCGGNELPSRRSPGAGSARPAASFLPAPSGAQALHCLAVPTPLALLCSSCLYRQAALLHPNVIKMQLVSLQFACSRCLPSAFSNVLLLMTSLRSLMSHPQSCKVLPPKVNLPDSNGTVIPSANCSIGWLSQPPQSRPWFASQHGCRMDVAGTAEATSHQWHSLASWCPSALQH